MVNYEDSDLRRLIWVYTVYMDYSGSLYCVEFSYSKQARLVCVEVLRPFLNQRKGEIDRRKYFMINLHERMLPTSAGVEPATSWSPVGRYIQLSHRGRQSKLEIAKIYMGRNVRKLLLYASNETRRYLRDFLLLLANRKQVKLRY